MFLLSLASWSVHRPLPNKEILPLRVRACLCEMMRLRADAFSSYLIFDAEIRWLRVDAFEIWWIWVLVYKKNLCLNVRAVHTFVPSFFGPSRFCMCVNSFSTKSAKRSCLLRCTSLPFPIFPLIHVSNILIRMFLVHFLNCFTSHLQLFALPCFCLTQISLPGIFFSLLLPLKFKPFVRSCSSAFIGERE